MNRVRQIEISPADRLSRRERENVALAILATACIGGIVLLSRVG